MHVSKLERGFANSILTIVLSGSGPFYHMAPLNQSEDSPLLPPLFTPRRQTQHRNALHQAAEETGIDIVDVSLDWAVWIYGKLIHSVSVPRPPVLEDQRQLRLG
jgi:hypothetical protein